MGLDEALLMSETQEPTLRLYRWDPPGLSMGYFQSSSHFKGMAGDHVLVRRLTGGGAIWHENELTISLTLDATLLPAEVPDSYTLIHAAVCEALAEVGVVASFPDRQDSAPSKGRPTTPWCFAEPVAQDLLTSSRKKLFGSAQRRVRRPRSRVLHHGSLVLTAPEATPFCGSVQESVAPETVSTQLEDALARQLAAALNLRPREGSPTPAELEHGHQLARERYGADTFTHRR